MKNKVSHFLLVALLSSYAHGQRGLTKIPDTSIQAQLDAFVLPEGAKINLFAREPVVRNPIHMNWDSQGRLWVVGSPLYPHIKPGQEENDQVVVLEDTDGDGVADESVVFADNLHIPTGVLPGDGGVYVANSNDVLFLADTNDDGKADHREVVLSGFGTEDTHHIVHTFRWGPEGMMWLNQSIYIHTHLDTPYGIRRLLGGGMWHYRPETRRSEVFMKGLVNPWGHVFDKWGQSFMTDGAGGQGINFVYPRAVFVASPGAPRRVQGLNPGQPKLCGLEVLSGTHIPEHWRGALASPDFRGHRIKTYRLSDKGSAFESREYKELLASKHGAFRPIDVKMGPDGAIYVADLYNPIIQHGEVDFRDPRRDHKHGRIWRISFPENPPAPFTKPAEMNSKALAEALLFSEENIVRELATAELRTRDADKMLSALNSLELKDDLHIVRRVWATQALNRLDIGLAKQLTKSKSHNARAAGLRAIYYDASNQKYKNLLSIAEEAVSDPSPHVRLWGVSLLAQLNDPQTVAIALRALEGVEVDDFLDFAVWSICREHRDRWVNEMKTKGENPFDSLSQLLFASSAIGEPLGADQILDSLAKGKIREDKKVWEVANWIANKGTPAHLQKLLDLALQTASVSQRHAYLNAMLTAKKIRKINPLGSLEAVRQFMQSENDTVWSTAVELAGLWKLESARANLEVTLKQTDSRRVRKYAAINSLIAMGGEQTRKFFDEQIQNPQVSYPLKSALIKGQLKIQPQLAARRAVHLMRSIPKGQEPNALFSAFIANKGALQALTKELQNSKLPEDVALKGMQLAESAPTRPQALIRALQASGGLKPMKMSLSRDEMIAMIDRVNTKGNAIRGESVYRRENLQCVACHAIGEVGGVIGPNLVSIGASAPVDYLIESLLEPSKKIKEGYHTNLIILNNGDSYAGGILSETDSEVVVRDLTGKRNRVAKRDIASQTISPVSLMPVGLTSQLREDEFVDLVRFMVELGKEGEFKTSSRRFARKWEVLPAGSPNPGTIHHYGAGMFTQEFSGYEWKPFFAMVGGGIPVDEVPVALKRRSDEYQVLRTHVEVARAGKHKVRLKGDSSNMDLFLEGEPIEIPSGRRETELAIDCKKTGKQQLMLVLQGPQSDGQVALEALSEDLNMLNSF
ncbi:MAG: PVC-type heme-binding CxxCH protein [Verrucomicrobiota bacterium]|nr:PVC-type heme-binding CxxCH protein [Verrucomicrobiota bacterium]MEE3062316.1 PVC-type heme-binding CxxCH protein [Verrucomicrobiota bacterium]